MKTFEVVFGDVEARIVSLRLQRTLQSLIKEAQSKSSEEKEQILWKIQHSDKTELLKYEEGVIRFGRQV